MKYAHSLITALLMLGLSVSFVACGGGSSDSGDSSDAQTETTTTTPAPAPEPEATATDIPDAVELSIEGNDQMKYNKDRFEVYEGQTVTLSLVHVGQMAKELMGHNWVLLKQGTDVAEFGLASATPSPETDYIPAGTEDQIIVHTKMLGGGESDTIEFEAPAVGEYDFLCSFPGHYALMKGKFVVKARP